MKKNKIKKLIKITIILLIILVFIEILIIKLNKSKIDYYSQKCMLTYSIYNRKYKISNKEELNAFYNIYTGWKLPDKYDLEKYTVFIETQSGIDMNDNLELKNVKIDDKIHFEYNKDDITLVNEGNNKDEYVSKPSWYLVAIIPNSKLKKVDTNEWRSPIDEKSKIISKKYVISVKVNTLNLVDVYNIINDLRNKIEDITIENLNYFSNNGTIEFKLSSYDFDKSVEFIKSIKSMDNMNAEIESVVNFKNYLGKEFNFSTEPKVSYVINLWGNNSFSDSFGEQIANELNADTVENSSGIIQMRFNNFNIQDITKNINRILVSMESLDLKEFSVNAYWTY